MGHKLESKAVKKNRVKKTAKQLYETTMAVSMTEDEYHERLTKLEKREWGGGV